MPARRKSAPPSRKSRSHERFGGLAEQVRGGKDTSRLATSGLADSIGFLLRVASGVAQARFGVRLDKLGLRPSLYSVLLIIAEEPGLKQQEVGRILSIQQPNLVALINELVQRGLVARTVNSEDRRSYSLILTTSGQALLRQASSADLENEQALAKALGPLPVHEFRAALVRILGITPPKIK